MQIDTKPKDARKVMSATMPMNISDADRKALIAEWEAKAAARNAAIAKEYETPKEASRVLRFELKQFGSKWQAYALSKGGKRMEPLLQSVSLLSSALAVLGDAMYEQATSGKR